MKNLLHTSQQTQPTVSDIDAPQAELHAERVTRPEIPGLALSSWRPSAQLSAIERYGRFEVLGRVGRGGMAEILLARERSPGGSMRHLVVKRILPEIADCDEMLNMFLDEAKVVMGLSHPNLCQIYEVGEQDGAWFIAMEWVNGATLHQLIKRAVTANRLNYPVLACVVSQCAEALHHAHTARDAEGSPLRLVHRDVSPHNLMVAFDGRVKLLDFGIAKSTASTHRTEAGVVKGKVCYMAPEQWLSGHLDARTDVFALGACLYEAITGVVLFKRDSQAEVMQAIIDGQVRPITELAPEVPAELAEIAHRALAVSPSDRFQTARAMSEALERFLRTVPEPIGAARVADYARGLFKAEVELGPMLERSVRGALLEPVALLLPPVPSALLGLPRPTPSGESWPQLPGEDPWRPRLHTILAPAPSTPVGTPSSHRSRARGRASTPPERASSEERALESFEGFDAGEYGTEVDARFDHDPAVPLFADAPRRGPSAFSEAPTRPMPGLEESADADLPAPRPLRRTVSMRVDKTKRRVLLGLLSAAALMLVYAVGSGALHMRAGQPVARGSSRLPAQTGALAPRALDASSEATFAHERDAARRALAAPHADGRIKDAAALAPSPVRQQLPAVELQPARPNVGVREGLLSINTRPWSTVYLGKRVLGTTPIAEVRVPGSVLSLKLVDRDGRVHIRRIARSEDKTRTVFFDFEAE